MKVRYANRALRCAATWFPAWVLGLFLFGGCASLRFPDILDVEYIYRVRHIDPHTLETYNTYYAIHEPYYIVENKDTAKERISIWFIDVS